MKILKRNSQGKEVGILMVLICKNLTAGIRSEMITCKKGSVKRKQNISWFSIMEISNYEKWYSYRVVWHSIYLIWTEKWLLSQGKWD